MLPFDCACPNAQHPPRLVVVTGGPGAGKTALLETVRMQFCPHVAVLKEAAGIVFGGGFPRLQTPAGKRAAQRAIFRLQRELETLTLEERAPAMAVCDRGTLDALAYWPDAPESFYAQLATTLQAELSRYAAVLHLRVPPPSAYNRQNPLRIESAQEAARIDARIAEVWSQHPHYAVIESSDDFLTKVDAGLDALRSELPTCCRPPPRASGGRR